MADHGGAHDGRDARTDDGDARTDGRDARTDGGNDRDDGDHLREFASLDGREATERAFELGVADACAPNGRSRAAHLADVDTERALDLLRDTGETTYDRSLIDLAYEEGRTRALKLSRDGDDGEAVWTQLVGDGVDADMPRSEPFEEALPGALGRLQALDIETDTGPPESLSLPKFLRR